MTIDEKSMLYIQCVASNMCHEIANHISIIKFMQDCGTTLDDVFRNVDVLGMFMDFFRNLYSPSVERNEVLNIVLNLYRLKGIKISGLDNKTSDIINKRNIERAIAIILYSILKTSRQNTEVILNAGAETTIINVKGGQQDLESDINNNLNKKEISVFSVLLQYAKSLAQIDGYVIRTDSKIANVLRVIVCKP